MFSYEGTKSNHKTIELWNSNHVYTYYFISLSQFSLSCKDITDGNIHLWHQKYPLHCTKVLGFVACRVKSTVLGIGAAESSWGDIKTFKSYKNLILVVMYLKNRVFFIHIPVLNKLELNYIILTNNLIAIFQIIPRTKWMTLLINS